MLTDITLGQYYPGNSFVHRLDPRTKIIATFVFMVTIFMAESALSYGLLLAFVLLVGLVSKISMDYLSKPLNHFGLLLFLRWAYIFLAGRENLCGAGMFFISPERALYLASKCPCGSFFCF